MGQQIESALMQSVHRVLVLLVNFLPGLVAFLLAVIVLAAIGMALSFLARKILTAVRFDDRVSARQTPGAFSNVSEWSPSNSPTRLISRAILWICLLGGVALGISAFNASFSDTDTFALFFLPYLTHIVGAALILLGGTLLARFLARSVLISSVNAQLQYARFLSLGVKWLVLVLTAAMALDHLSIGGGIVELAFGILFGGIVLTLSLAVGLGSRDLVTRSIEKTMDKPSPLKPDLAPHMRPEAQQPPPLRHF